MLSSGDVSERQVEQEDAGDPSVDHCVGLKVGVVEHAFDVLRVDFNDELLDADDVDSECPECAK